MTDTDTPTEEEQAQPFSQWLFAQRNGATHAELTDGLAELAQAVMDTGKSGSLTLTIKVGKASKKGGHQMLVADEVVVKAPKATRSESIFFFDERNASLARTDPQQMPLPLQEVPKPTSELKESSLWADRDAGRIVAVLNDHNSDRDTDPEFAGGWGDHRATLTLRKTPAWEAWTGASGRLVPQRQFAEFLEDRAGEVVSPDHAVLLEVASSIEGATAASYKSAVRLDNGEVRFRYEETVEARAGQAGDLVIPTRIELALSPFEGMEPYRVTARFRYRIDGSGNLSLGVVLDRPEDVLRAAFADVVAAVESETELVVLYGTPAA